MEKAKAKANEMAVNEMAVNEMAKANEMAAKTAFTLTHNLYSRDEVVLACLTALLKKQDINECYYWLNELCISVSVSDIRKIIGHIYYDFYYALNDDELDSLDSLDYSLDYSPDSLADSPNLSILSNNNNNNTNNQAQSAKNHSRQNTTRRNTPRSSPSPNKTSSLHKKASPSSPPRCTSRMAK